MEASIDVTARGRGALVLWNLIKQFNFWENALKLKNNNAIFIFAPTWVILFRRS